MTPRTLRGRYRTGRRRFRAERFNRTYLQRPLHVLRAPNVIPLTCAYYLFKGDTYHDAT